MDAASPAREKPDTSSRFSPAYELDAFHVDRVQSITRRDGELSRYGIHPHWVSALRRQAYVTNAHASASIEGNTLTLEEAEKVVRRLEAVELKRPQPDEREIAQHYQYFRGLENRQKGTAPDLTVDEIEKTHRELLTGVVPKEKRAGEIRGPSNVAQVYVGRIVGTPPHRVRADLESLTSWYYGPGASLPLPIRVAIWFHEFEAIHPFRDGNGRVGRALTHRLLATDGLPNSLLVALDRPFNDDRPEYYGSLETVQTTGRYDQWVGYFLASLHEAYATSVGLLQQLTRIPEEVTGAPRVILEYVLRAGQVRLQVGTLTSALGRYKPITISLALTKLARDGWLQHNELRGRASVYAPGRRLQQILANATARPR